MSEELEAERAYVDAVYERLEELRDRARLLAEEAVIRDEDQVVVSLFERDVAAAQAARRLATLDVRMVRVAMGRLDLEDGERPALETSRATAALTPAVFAAAAAELTKIAVHLDDALVEQGFPRVA